MGRAPENTYVSFEKAWRAGADAVECDVHLSRDGRLVVMHDETLDRTSSGAGFIRDARWPAIRRLDAGAWFHRRFHGERVPDFPGLLRWLKKRRSPAGAPLKIVVEIKNEKIRYPGIAEAVVKALRAADFAGRAAVISFDHGVVRRVKRLDRSLFTGILFHERLQDLRARVKWAGADAVFPRRNLVNAAFMRAARRLGVFIGTWTVNEPAEMKRLLKLGVDGIASNYPDRLVALLGRR